MTDRVELNNGLTDSLGNPSFAFVGRSTPIYIQDSGSSSGNIQSIEVAAMSIPAAIQDIGTDVNNKGMAGFDTIFSPYTTASGHNELPHFEIPTNLTDPNSYTLDPFNPNNIFDTGVSQAVNNDRFARSGHNIQIANTWQEAGVGTTGDASFVKDLYDNGTFTYDGVRSIGLKAPMVLSGWGFDTNGKPVPADTGNVNIFASGAFRDPNLWKTGPVDLRWDDERKVWGSPPTKIYLSKATNTYNPSSFSYEVDRSDSRSQFTRSAPSSLRTVNLTEPIHDPESIAYTNNSDNVGSYEQLNYASIDYPFYEAFIIRETTDTATSNEYYNIWSEDCQDCGHITNSGCGTQHGSSSEGKKILIENPLRQNIDVGDLMFTVKTGRSKKVNTGTFTGGTGAGASGEISVNSSGTATTNITAAGTGYTLGAFAIANGNICVGISLGMTAGALTSITLDQTTGFTSGTYPLEIIPNDANVTTETLDIHWILQAEFKTQQIVTHVECEGGILQSCSQKIQTQGFSSCEWCGEDTTYINSF